MLSKIRHLFTSQSKPAVYFTVHTGQQGFTDQIMQLSAFYKLGRACGLPFYYVPFISDRSQPLVADSECNETLSSYQDVYDFLGVNKSFNAQEVVAFNDEFTFEVNLSDAILEKEGISNFELLASYVKSKVTKQVLRTKTKKTWLVILRMDRARPKPGKTKRQFFALINSSPKANKFSIDFRSIYERERLNKPVKSIFKQAHSKVLIHIRQGDTSVLKTPWNTFIPVDGRRPDFLNETDTLEEIKARYHDKFVDSIFTSSDFYQFLKNFKSHCTTSPPSVGVFSDGFRRAVDRVVQSTSKMALSNEQIQELKAYRETVDNEAFKEFFEDKDISCHIGESALSLYQLIDSALHADIIITSAQQRMLPKLIANYSPRGGPAVIVLYRNEEPDYSDVIAAHKARFIYVNIDAPNYEYISRRLINFGLKL